MFKQNRNLLIIALIAVVNALGYGIIIPVLYSYSIKFGLSDFQNGLLFAAFSLGQFIATPIIGRMSDKYGRKPLLVISLFGTALSFFMMAFAPNAIFLFIARALDGITAGNIPVASAVISDTTHAKNRARGFGIIGASFGFGFVFGPAISAFTVGYSDKLPFIIAGSISLLAVIITAIFLPETNKHIGHVKHTKLFDFGKLIHALKDKNVGLTLVNTLLYSTAFGMFIFAFQPFSLKILHLSANQISLLYTLFGIVGLISQLFLLHRFSEWFGLKKTYSTSLLFLALSFVGMFMTRSLQQYILLCITLALANSMVNPLTQTILSKETDEHSQGTMQGINFSYMSIGQIIGPILAGLFATFSIPSPFLGASLFSLAAFVISFQVLQGVPLSKVEHTKTNITK